MSLTVIRDCGKSRAGLSICLDRDAGCMIADFADAERGAPLVWEHGVTVSLGAVELAKILEVMRGHTESIDDGKGLYLRRADDWVVLRVSHMIEPLPGYRFEVVRCRNGAHIQQRITVYVRPDEAFALSLGIDMAISELVCRRA